MTPPATPKDARIPIAGESLLAWSVRLAAARGRGHVWALLRETGLPYLAKPSALLRRADAAVVANTLGIDRAEVERRMLLPASPAGFERIDGVRVRSADVVTQARRFSPTTLAADGTHLAIWNLRTLPFCPRSMEYLTDRCAVCGTVQRWRRSILVTRCDRCGSGLWMHDAEVVEPPLHDALRSVATLVDIHHPRHGSFQDALPPALRHLDAGAAFELVLAVARIIDPDLGLREPAKADRDRQRRLTRALARSWSCVLRWPDGLISAIEGVPLRDAGRRLSEASRAHGPRAAMPEVTAVVDDAIAEGRSVPVKRAARMLGATETDVARARDEGILRTIPVLRNGRLSLHLCASETSRLAGIRLDRLGTRQAGRILGMPAYALEQLVASELITPHDHRWLTGRYLTPVLIRADVVALANKIVGGSVLIGGEVVPLAAAMRGYGGGPKPWSRIVEGLMREEWSFEAGVDDDGKLRILVERNLIDTIVSLSPGPARRTYTREEALEILNLKFDASVHLEAFASADGSAIDGEAVGRMAATRISPAEVMARTGLPHKSAQHRLAQLGCLRIDAFGWSRCDTINMLSHLNR